MAGRKASEAEVAAAEREPIRSDTKTLQTRLPQDDNRDLERVALFNDRSVAAELRRAVRHYLRTHPDARAVLGEGE